MWELALSIPSQHSSGANAITEDALFNASVHEILLALSKRDNHLIVAPIEQAQASDSTIKYSLIDVLEVLHNNLYQEEMEGALVMPIERWLTARANLLAFFDSDDMVTSSVFPGAFEKLVFLSSATSYLNSYYEVLVQLLAQAGKAYSDDLFFGAPVSICDLILNADSYLDEAGRICYLPFSPLWLSSAYFAYGYEKLQDSASGGNEILNSILAQTTRKDFSAHRRILGDTLYLIKEQHGNAYQGVQESQSYSRIKIHAVRLFEKIRDSIVSLYEKNVSCVRIAIVGDIEQDDFCDLLMLLHQSRELEAFHRDENTSVKITVYSSVFQASAFSKDAAAEKAYQVQKESNLSLRKNSDVSRLFFDGNEQIRHDIVFFLDVLDFYTNSNRFDKTVEESNVLRLSRKLPLLNSNIFTEENALQTAKNCFDFAQRTLTALVGQRVMTRNVYGKNFNLGLYRKIRDILNSAPENTFGNRYHVFVFVSKLEVLNNNEIRYQDICRFEQYEGNKVAGIQLSGRDYTYDLQQQTEGLDNLAAQLLGLAAAPHSITVSAWQIMKFIRSDSYCDLYKGAKAGGFWIFKTCSPFYMIEVLRNYLLKIDYQEIGQSNSKVFVDIALHEAVSKEMDAYERIVTFLKPILEQILKAVFLNPANMVQNNKDRCVAAISGALFNRSSKVSDVVFANVVSNQSARNQVFHHMYEQPGSLVMQWHCLQSETAFDPEWLWMSRAFDSTTKQPSDKRYYSYLVESGDASRWGSFDEAHNQGLLRIQRDMDDYSIRMRRASDNALIARACELLNYKESYLYENVHGQQLCFHHSTTAKSIRLK